MCQSAVVAAGGFSVGQEYARTRVAPSLAGGRGGADAVLAAGARPVHVRPVPAGGRGAEVEIHVMGRAVDDDLDRRSRMTARARRVAGVVALQPLPGKDDEIGERDRAIAVIVHPQRA